MFEIRFEGRILRANVFVSPAADGCELLKSSYRLLKTQAYRGQQERRKGVVIIMMNKAVIAVPLSLLLAFLVMVTGMSSAKAGVETRTGGYTFDEHSVPSDSDGAKEPKLEMSDADAGECTAGCIDSNGIFYDIFDVRAAVSNTALLRAETTSYDSAAAAEPTGVSFPEQGIRADVLLNGEEIIHGCAAYVDDVLYVSAEAFWGEVAEDFSIESESGRINICGRELSAEAGESYITFDDRVLWCGENGKVTLFGDALCIPLEPLCRMLGLTLTLTEYGSADITGDVVLRGADDIYDTESLYWLSHIISAESRGEPLNGQIAVGCVVMNRLRTLGDVGSVYDVIFDRRYGIQFSPAYSGSVYAEPTDSCIRAAKICLEGYTISDEILYFINTADTPASWLTERCRLVMTVGHHDFYA